jgi:lantibiotic modifying enzyme
MSNILKGEHLSFSVEDILIQQLILKSPYIHSCNLFDGKTGVMLFFFEYYKSTDEIMYKRFAEYLLEQIWNDIDIDLPVNLAYGLSGLGVAIEYLAFNNFIDCENTVDLCENLIKQIMSKDVSRIEEYTFETGIGGLIYYILLHEKHNNGGAFDPLYLKIMYEKCIEINKFPMDKDTNFFVDSYINFYHNGKPIEIEVDLSNIIQKDISVNIDNVEKMRLGLHNGISGFLYNKLLRK